MDSPTDQRLEEARAHEQAEDFARQEKILKLISTELSKNTQRVVEMAVKNEVQNSVLPSLEHITKTEVKAALGNQISKGLSDSFKQVSLWRARIFLPCSPWRTVEPPERDREDASPPGDIHSDCTQRLFCCIACHREAGEGNCREELAPNIPAAIQHYAPGAVA